MALTVTSINGRKESMGSKRFEIVNIVPDDSWLAAGEALTAATLGFATIDCILIEPSGGYTFEYDHANAKLLAYHADYSTGTDGPLIAVPDGTDLDALTGIRALVIGTV